MEFDVPNTRLTIARNSFRLDIRGGIGRLNAELVSCVETDSTPEVYVNSDEY